MVDIKWPPATVPLVGNELVPLLQGGKIAGATPTALMPPITITGGGVAVPDYATIRATAFPSNTNTITLTDIRYPGVFVRGTGSDNGGTRIKDSTGQTWIRQVESRVNAAWFYNCPGHYLGDLSNVLVTAVDQAANPQWIGMPDNSGPYPVGTRWDYVALQEWVYCLAADASTPGSVIWNSIQQTYWLNKRGFVPPGRMVINQKLVITGAGLDIEFNGKLGAQIQWAGTGGASGNATLSNVGPAIYFNTLAYSHIRGLSVLDQCGTTNCLVALDHYNVGGLNTQANTFIDWVIGSGNNPNLAGSRLSQAAIQIGLFGTVTQGDSQIFIGLIVTGAFYDGVVIQGQNAVGVTFIGGNLNGCFRSGINCRGGTVNTYGMITESAYTGNTGTTTGGPVFTGAATMPQINQITMDGCDFQTSGGYGPSTENLISGTRSESVVLCVDANNHTTIQSTSIVPGATIPTRANSTVYLPGTVLQSVSPSPAPPSTPPPSFVMVVDDGGYPWFAGDPASTGNTAVFPGNPGWTTNQWVGYLCWIRTPGNGRCFADTIWASTSNSITFQNGGFSFFGPTIMYKIAGKVGATVPNWAGVAQATYSATQRGSAGWGFTTTAGSNIVSGSMFRSGPGYDGGQYYANPGQWVCICGAQDFVQNGGAPGSITMTGPLIAKIASVDNVVPYHATLVDAYNNPVNASYSLSDTYGYYGVPITDGQVTLLPLDWYVAYGLKRASGVDFGLDGGRMYNANTLLLDADPGFRTQANFIAADRGLLPGQIVDFRQVPPIYKTATTWTNLAGGVSVLNMVAGPTAGRNDYIGSAHTLPYLVGNATLTINFPPEGSSVIDEFDLQLTAHAPGAVITWGTNVRAASPTLTLGTANQVTTVTMKWVGINGLPQDPTTAGGAWYVKSISGAA